MTTSHAIEYAPEATIEPGPWSGFVTATEVPQRQGCILVAEDDPSMRELMVQSLRLDGYDVLDVRDGGELIDHLEAMVEGTHGPDSVALIISDVRMPGLTGLDVVHALRQASWTLPIVLVTAFGSAKVHQQAHALGAFILDKPFDLDRLREIARTFVALPVRR
jgi:CheY-like chemotaxis protein